MVPNKDNWITVTLPTSLFGMKFLSPFKQQRQPSHDFLSLITKPRTKKIKIKNKNKRKKSQHSLYHILLLTKLFYFLFIPPAGLRTVVFPVVITSILLLPLLLLLPFFSNFTSGDFLLVCYRQLVC